jgi:porphobilinogen deaminase
MMLFVWARRAHNDASRWLAPGRLESEVVRGNVQTRLAKLDAKGEWPQKYDALILAEVGSSMGRRVIFLRAVLFSLSI